MNGNSKNSDRGGHENPGRREDRVGRRGLGGRKNGTGPTGRRAGGGDEPEVYHVIPGPDPEHETVVPYYAYSMHAFEYVFHNRPSRNTVGKYKDPEQKPGYPVKRHGPYIVPPTFLRFKQPMTTVESFQRFLFQIASHEARLGVYDLDASRLNSIPPLPPQPRPGRKKGKQKRRPKGKGKGQS